MLYQSIYFISIFVILSVIVFISPNAWFIYFPKEYLYGLSFICSIFQVLVYFMERKKINIQLKPSVGKLGLYALLLLSIVFILFFPIQNLNLGDGVLLLERVALEAKIFGFLLTMDEILEAMIHSFLFGKFFNYFSTPWDVYRLLSSSFGMIALGILVYYFRKWKVGFFGYFLVLSSGGIYLFYGYSENYTITTTGLWLYTLYGIEKIKENQKRNLEVLIPMSLIACLLVLLHLVSGYLAFSLLFLCYYFSDSGKFIRNAIICTFVSLLVLAPVFIYFSFFSDVRFDFTQTHLTNPKFYPLRKIISIHHFRDIFYCIIGSSFLGFLIIIYFLIFKKQEWKLFIQKKEIQFLLTVLFGFGLHGFIFYPQLGFPADWDLMSFYWTPIVFLSVLIWSEFGAMDKTKEINPILFIPLFLFIGFIFIGNAVYLNKPDLEKLKELKESISSVETFYESDLKNQISKVKPSHKKFYLSVSYFLFKTGVKLSQLQPNEEIQNLLSENQEFRLELEKNISQVDSKWQKDFYSRMTVYNVSCLKLFEKK